MTLQLRHNRARLLAATGRPEAREAVEDVVRRARAVASQDPRLLAEGQDASRWAPFVLVGLPGDR